MLQAKRQTCAVLWSRCRSFISIHPTTGNQARAETSGSNSSFLNTLIAGSNRTAFWSSLFHKRGSSPALVLGRSLQRFRVSGLLRPNVCASSKSRFWRPGESGQNGREPVLLKYSAIWKGLPSKKNCRYGDTARHAIRYRNPGPQFYVNTGIPLDEVEDCFCDLRRTAKRDAY